MKRTILTVLLSLSIAAGGAYAMIRTLPLSDLVKKADLVMIASVAAIAEDGKQDEYVFKKNELKPEQILKGKLDPKETVAIRTTSLANGRYLEDALSFSAVGSKVLIFLTRNAEGKWTAVNGIQGMWPIEAKSGDLLGMGTGKKLADVQAEIAKQGSSK